MTNIITEPSAKERIAGKTVSQRCDCCKVYAANLQPTTRGNLPLMLCPDETACIARAKAAGIWLGVTV